MFRKLNATIPIHTKATIHPYPKLKITTFFLTLPPLKHKTAKYESHYLLSAQRKTFHSIPSPRSGVGLKGPTFCHHLTSFRRILTITFCYSLHLITLHRQSILFTLQTIKSILMRLKFEVGNFVVRCFHSCCIEWCFFIICVFYAVIS